jgi:hypothetical protein
MATQTFLGAAAEEGEGYASRKDCTGLSRCGNDWVASVPVNDVVHQVGIFTDHYKAAMAYDMEALRAFGKNASALNFRYKLLEESTPANNNCMKLLDSQGLTLAVDVSPDPASYAPVSVPPPAVNNFQFNIQESSAMKSRGAPPLPDPARSYHARNSSLYTPSASFVYEITFPHKKSLGLNLKPHLVYFSPESEQYIGTLVVVEAMTLLSSLVYPGMYEVAIWLAVYDEMYICSFTVKQACVCLE